MSDQPTSTHTANPVDDALVAAPRDASPRCPRCGARMGALAIEDAGRAALYCGCCGLVVSDAR